MFDRDQRQVIGLACLARKVAHTCHNLFEDKLGTAVAVCFESVDEALV
jgi:hypothetical protein